MFLVKHPNRKVCQKPSSQVTIKTSDKSIYCLTSESNEDVISEATETTHTKTTESQAKNDVVEDQSLTVASEEKASSDVKVLLPTNEAQTHTVVLEQEIDEAGEDEEFELTEETLVVTNPRDDLLVRSVEEAVSVEDKLSPVGENKIQVREPPLVYVDQVELIDETDPSQPTGSDSQTPLPNTNESFFTYNRIRLRIVDTAAAATLKTAHNECLPLIESFQLVDQNDEISEASRSVAVTCWSSASNANQFSLEGRQFELREYPVGEALLAKRDDVDDEQSKSNVATPTAATCTNEESEEEVKSISSIEGSLKAGHANDRLLCGNSSSTPLMCLYPNLSKSS